MNKIKFLPIVLFASAITLASCNFLGGSSSKKKSSKKSSSGENTSLTSSSTKGDSGSSKSGSTGGTSKSSSGGSSKSSSSSGKTSSSSGKTSSSSGGGSSSTSSGGGETGYTLDSVAADINAAFSSVVEEGGDLLQYNSSKGYWFGGLYLDEETDTQAPQATLQPAVEFMAAYMPTYLTKVYTHFWTSDEDYWEDESGDTVYEEAYQTPGSEVIVDILGYCYEGYLNGDVYVYVPSN